MGDVAVVVNTGLLVANLIVFGLGLKLYTEILKDASQANRSARIDGAHSEHPRPSSGEVLLKADAYLACAVEELRKSQDSWANRSLPGGRHREDSVSHLSPDDRTNRRES